MEYEIEESLQEKFNTKRIRINVEYESIRRYTITLLIRNLPLETGIVLKTIIFSYDWLNNYMFDSNIEQLYYEIKNILEKEGIYDYVCADDSIKG